MLRKLLSSYGLVRRKRTNARERHAIIVEYPRKERELFDYCRDISERGLFIETMRPLPVGSGITICFRFPNTGREISAKAVVQWTRTDRFDQGPGGMGMEFIDMLDEDRKLLTQFLGQEQGNRRAS